MSDDDTERPEPTVVFVPPVGDDVQHFELDPTDVGGITDVWIYRA